MHETPTPFVPPRAVQANNWVGVSWAVATGRERGGNRDARSETYSIGVTWLRTKKNCTNPPTAATTPMTPAI